MYFVPPQYFGAKLNWLSPAKPRKPWTNTTGYWFLNCAWCVDWWFWLAFADCFCVSLVVLLLDCSFVATCWWFFCDVDVSFLGSWVCFSTFWVSLAFLESTLVVCSFSVVWIWRFVVFSWGSCLELSCFVFDCVWYVESLDGFCNFTNGWSISSE